MRSSSGSSRLHAAEGRSGREQRATLMLLGGPDGRIGRIGPIGMDTW